MANVVEIALRGVDQTGPVVAASRRLRTETQALGSAFTQAGNIAAVFANQALADLTAKAGLLTTSFRALTEVVSKLGFLRAGIIGVAVAMGAWLVQRGIAAKQAFDEKIANEAKELRELEKSINATAAAQKTLNERRAEGAIGGQDYEKLRKQLEELSLAQYGRKLGAVMGDPITPNNPVNDVNALKPGPSEAGLAASKLIEEHRRQRAELEEAFAEFDEQFAAETQKKIDDDYELFEAIEESRKKHADAEMVRLKERAAALAELAAFEAELQAARDRDSVRALEIEADMERQGRLEKLDGLALVQAQIDANHEDRLRQIAELNLAEDESIRLSNMAGVQAAEQRKRLNKEVVNATVSGASQMFGNLASAAQAFGKKGTKVAQGFAIVKALMDTYTAANGAYSAMASIPYVGPALGAAAAAAAIAAGMANVSSIRSQQAHGGIDRVPQDSTYVLKQGEMVLDPGTSEQVRNAAMNRFGGESGAGRMTRVTVYIGDRVLLDTVAAASRDGRIEIDARAIT